MFTFVLVLAIGVGDTVQAPVVPAPAGAPMVAQESDVLSTPLLARPAVGSPTSVPFTVPAVTWSPGVVTDTTRPRHPRAKAIEYSDWYETRLAIHKAASWATLPLFVGQYLTGETLMTKGTDSPDWVKRTHPILATGVLALFATNTVTGVWNLWESREDPSGRAWRTTHSVLMLASDAGFAYVGSLSRNAKVSGSARSQHRAAALTSAGLALVSYVMMLPPFRQD